MNELASLLERFEATFGETAPLTMLPSDEQAAIALLRRVIDARDTSLLEADLPEGAVI